MMLRAFSVLDTKTGAFAIPFFVHHVALAKRMIFEAVQDERSSLAKYPADFALFAIGAFDDTKGSMVNITPENLGSVASIYAAELNARPNIELTRAGREFVENGVTGAEAV